MTFIDRDNEAPKAKIAINAERIRANGGNKRCAVCGGRESCCFLLGHRPEGDRNILWHPDDIKGCE